MERLMPHLDGVYALAVTDGEVTVIARDRIGVRQLYYSFARGLTAFASEKKSLVALLGKDARIHRLPPGRMMVVEPGRKEMRTYWRPSSLKTDELIRDPNEAIREYGKVLKSAVEKRVHDRERVGVIYSGGIDSFMIAFLVQKLGVPFTCYVAGRDSGSSDVDWAVKTAAEHDFPLEVKRLSAHDIEQLVPDVIRTIEDHSLNQVEVAVPVFASIRMAQEAGERVVLTGQGADELFGGYPWYSTIVDREGYDNFLERSWEDTFLLYKECLEREDKIAMAHSIELRVPYLDPEVIKFAFSVAPQHKIRKGEDALAKRIHRALGIVLGIPEDVAFRSKEAAQHGANVHDVFEELAVRRGYSPELLDAVGYDPDASVTEKLGSSSRYGYRYGDQKLWEPMPHVQYYLDTQAAEVGILTGGSRQQLNDTRERLAAIQSG
jgi:asparagine synthase (glutamine-hydrolysing)